MALQKKIEARLLNLIHSSSAFFVLTKTVVVRLCHLFKSITYLLELKPILRSSRAENQRKRYVQISVTSLGEVLSASAASKDTPVLPVNRQRYLSLFHSVLLAQSAFLAIKSTNQMPKKVSLFWNERSSNQCTCNDFVPWHWEFLCRSERNLQAYAAGQQWPRSPGSSELLKRHVCVRTWSTEN